MVHGAAFNPDADTVVAWLGEVLKERDPVVAFLQEGVVPLCEDPVAAIITGGLPVPDARGLPTATASSSRQG